MANRPDLLLKSARLAQRTRAATLLHERLRLPMLARGKGDKEMQNAILMRRSKKIALIAHDNKKEELIEWARINCDVLAGHWLYATGATGYLLKSRLGLNVTHLESGPLGGDQQIGSRISEGQIDFVIFFSDPLEPQPHDSDVKALLRIAVVWNIPVACNRASADFIISSPLMSAEYERQVPDYSRHRARLAVQCAQGDELAGVDVDGPELSQSARSNVPFVRN
jgi:methylglyoxal synthase